MAWSGPMGGTMAGDFVDLDILFSFFENFLVKLRRLDSDCLSVLVGMVHRDPPSRGHHCWTQGCLGPWSKLE